MKKSRVYQKYDSDHQKLVEFMQLVEVSGMVFFRCVILENGDCELVYISENIAQFGYESEDFLSQKIHYESLIHDDDIEYFLKAFDEKINSATSKFSLLHRIVTTQSQIRWINVEFLVKRDKNGVAKTLRGVINDITEIVEKENQVKLLAKALEASDNLVFITDANGIITYVNDSLVKHSGYSRDELLGARPSIFKSSKHDQKFYQQLWSTILTGRNYNNIIINKKKNGDLYYVDTSIIPIDDKYTRTKNFVATSKDVTIQMKLEQKLENLAITDSLTQIYNRYKINAEIDLHIAMAKRNHQPFSMLMFDIDHFKRVNDTYGHYVGDVVLKELTKLVENNIREVDAFGRWGGEEFMLLLDNTNKTEALHVANKLLSKVAQTPLSGHYSITISIGVSEYRIAEQKATLLERVDQALYEAKESGRNRVVFK